MIVPSTEDSHHPQSVVTNLKNWSLNGFELWASLLFADLFGSVDSRNAGVVVVGVPYDDNSAGLSWAEVHDNWFRIFILHN